MKNSARILLLLLLLVVFACGLKFWADNSLVVSEYRAIHDRDSEIDLAFAFATALRVNNVEAYEMIDPTLKSRLDEWMNSHQSRKCIREADYFLIGNGSNKGQKITFGCMTETSYLSYEVDDIIIEEMKVIDWGEVREGED